MTQLCIVVADDSRARLFTIEQPGADGTLSGPRLVERVDLANPDAKGRGSGAFSSSDERSRTGAGSSAHGYPDHRTGHSDEIRHRFAQRIINEVNEFIQQHAIRKLIFLVAPKMLGSLRDHADQILPRDIQRSEFAEDLSWHSVATIEQALLRRGQLSERVPVGGYRPHGQEP